MYSPSLPRFGRTKERRRWSGSNCSREVLSISGSRVRRQVVGLHPLRLGGEQLPTSNTSSIASSLKRSRAKRKEKGGRFFFLFRNRTDYFICMFRNHTRVPREKSIVIPNQRMCSGASFRQQKKKTFVCFPHFSRRILLLLIFISLQCFQKL